MSEPAYGGGRQRGLSWILLAAGIVYTFKVIGDAFFGGYSLDLGSGGMTTEYHTAFLALWGFFGLAAAAALTYGLLLLLSASRSRGEFPPLLAAGSDRRWILVTVVLALLIPVAIRTFVLVGAPVTDDESTYRFSAQLLARGQLYAESPPEKFFFDRSFMINDGRFYTQYFLGWPALMLPFLLLGVSGLANAFFSAATAPAVFLVARRVAGGRARGSPRCSI